MAEIRRYDEIMKSMVSNMVANQNKITDFNEGSVIYTILDTNARIAERLYVAIRQGYNEILKMLPYSPFGFEKKKGLLASGKVIFTREKELKTSSVIPKGTVVSGGGFSFTTTTAGIIREFEKESSEISVIANLVGTSSNIKANVIESIDSVVPSDITNVKNPIAFSGGTDEESDLEFEERFKNYLNGLSGTNVYAIKNAALSVDSVRSVSIQNHKPPLKDIYNLSIYIDDGSGSSSEETIEKVKLAVEGDGTDENPGHLTPGVNIRVLSPTTIFIDINLSFTVYPTDLVEAENEIKLILAQYINGLSIGKSVILSEIITKLMNLNYVKDVKIISPDKNVEPDTNQIARLGQVKMSFTEIDK